MKTIENATIYKCDFCPKYLMKKYALVKHEDLCEMNPKNHAACSGCEFMKETTVDVILYNHDYDYPEPYTSKSKAFECTKLKKMLYPMKVVRKGLVKKYPETFKDQEPMPSKCDLFQFKDYSNQDNQSPLIN